MIEIRAAIELRFRVLEPGTEWERFTVLKPLEKNALQVVEEAARLYFYGKGGWQEAWPLTFELETLGGGKVVTASVFILTAEPTFDVIELKPQPTNRAPKTVTMNPQDPPKTLGTAITVLAVTALITLLLEALSVS